MENACQTELGLLRLQLEASKSKMEEQLKKSQSDLEQ
jgi:hypothetical protein